MTPNKSVYNFFFVYFEQCYPNAKSFFLRLNRIRIIDKLNISYAQKEIKQNETIEGKKILKLTRTKGWFIKILNRNKIVPHIGSNIYNFFLLSSFAPKMIIPFSLKGNKKLYYNYKHQILVVVKFGFLNRIMENIRKKVRKCKSKIYFSEEKFVVLKKFMKDPKSLRKTSGTIRESYYVNKTFWFSFNNLNYCVIICDSREWWQTIQKIK